MQEAVAMVRGLDFILRPREWQNSFRQENVITGFLFMKQNVDNGVENDLKAGNTESIVHCC